MWRYGLGACNSMKAVLIELPEQLLGREILFSDELLSLTVHVKQLVWTVFWVLLGCRIMGIRCDIIEQDKWMKAFRKESII